MNNIIDQTPQMPTKGFKCALCDKLFLWNEQLQRHGRRVHGGKSFECNKCNFSSSWLESLKRHQEVKHADNNSLKTKPETIKQSTKGHGCGMCDYRSKRKHNIERYQGLKDQDIELNILSKLLAISNKRYKCGFCE